MATQTRPPALVPTIVEPGLDETSRAVVPSPEPAALPAGRLVRMLVHRGTAEEGGAFAEYLVPVEEGMVVLDALHWIQANVAPDLAVRWNCKAAKCGSCSAEVNGRPSLTCKTRLSDFPPDETITVEPMRTFPLIKDLVTDVSWNYEVNKRIVPFSPPADLPEERWRWKQEDIDRGQEFRKCIECFLCQDVCHVLRNHEIQSPFMGPRYLVRAAGLEMHPLDRADRLEHVRNEGGIGYCNITKCCTEVCPEHIKITDNAIIPLKERIADRHFDPLMTIWRWLRKATVDPRADLPRTGTPPPPPPAPSPGAPPADPSEGAA
jgi:succinate dehydrogenase / fumarate reductase iron-sulfur subunit